MSKRNPIPPGTRFTRLIVTDTTPEIRMCGGEPRHHVECKCDCGAVKWINEKCLKMGETRSCGCLKKEQTIARNTVHGHAIRGSYSQAYGSWKDMIQRCKNPNTRGFQNYGGRGIQIDPRWVNFVFFLQDMGEPNPGMTLERNNVNGHYCKANCCWIPRYKQNQNRRDSVILTAFGVTACMSELSRQHGVQNHTVWQRIKNGAHPECALSKDQWITRAHISSCKKCKSVKKNTGVPLYQ